MLSPLVKLFPLSPLIYVRLAFCYFTHVKEQYVVSCVNNWTPGRTGKGNVVICSFPCRLGPAVREDINQSQRSMLALHRRLGTTIIHLVGAMAAGLPVNFEMQYTMRKCN